VNEMLFKLTKEELLELQLNITRQDYLNLQLKNLQAENESITANIFQRAGQQPGTKASINFELGGIDFPEIKDEKKRI
jgi:hypothetical protein